jgi:hypothetical protein
MHDYDGINEIILVDRPVNKQMRKLLVHPDRNGFLVRHGPSPRPLLHACRSDRDGSGNSRHHHFGSSAR